jgi:hypothetical protein
MGLLTDKFVKDERKKNIIYWIKDIAIIIVFIILALAVREQWREGYDYCSSQACTICWMNPKISNNSNPLNISIPR